MLRSSQFNSLIQINFMVILYRYFQNFLPQSSKKNIKFLLVNYPKENLTCHKPYNEAIFIHLYISHL